MFDCLLVETKITTKCTVVLYKKKQCYSLLSRFILEISQMSVTLSVAQLCKHVLKITVEDFEKKKTKGHFKQNNGAQIKSTAAKVWDNLAKLFPCSEQVVQQNVTQTIMKNAVRSLMTGKNGDSVVLYTFSDERETRKG